MNISKYKFGWIQEFDLNEITCILRKDYELDEILTFTWDFLSAVQKQYVKIGQIIKYNKINKNILFLTNDDTWI